MIRRAIVTLGVGAWMVITSETTAFALDPERITIGGEARYRYEFRDDADFNRDVDDVLSFVGSRLRLHVGLMPTPDLELFFQIQDARLFGAEASTASNEKNLDLHQGFVKIRLAVPIDLVVGRQELVFGDSRLVGNFGWSNVGRSFDGARVAYRSERVRADLWGMITKQFGSNVGPDPTFGPSNRDTQQFYGLYTSARFDPVVIEPYVMLLRDTGNPNETDPLTGVLVSPFTAPAARGQDRATAGMRVDGAAWERALEVTLEGAYQTGRMEGRGPAAALDVKAYAYAVRAGYTLPAAVKPRIGVEYDYASGDSSPTDDRIETFENLFPTNHIHYGYMDYVGWRNMQDLRVSLGMKPTAQSGVSLDYHRFKLAESDDHWYAASGRPFRITPAGSSETDLGQEVDVVAYVVLKERVRVELGYGRFLPGAYVRENFPSAADASDFFYFQTAAGF